MHTINIMKQQKRSRKKREIGHRKCICICIESSKLYIHQKHVSIFILFKRERERELDKNMQKLILFACTYIHAK